VVETVGLENRCTGNRTGGSNPSPSATQSILQRLASALVTGIQQLPTAIDQADLVGCLLQFRVVTWISKVAASKFHAQQTVTLYKPPL
jgi:hypothetical protein